MAEVELTYTVPGKTNVDLVLTYDPSTTDANGDVLITGASGTYETLDAAGNVVDTDTVTGIYNSTAILHAPNLLNLSGTGPITTNLGIAFTIDNPADEEVNPGSSTVGNCTFNAVILGGYDTGKGPPVDVSLQAVAGSNTVYSYDADGNVTKAVTTNDDGSHSIEIDANRLTVHSIGTDTFEDNAVGTRFVFGHNFGAETIDGFNVSGSQHDVLSLPNSDAGRLGQILAHATGDGQGDTTLHLGHGDTITIDGISKAALKAHRSDFSFHA